MKIKKLLISTNPYNLNTRLRDFNGFDNEAFRYVENILENAENIKLINNTGPAIVYYFDIKRNTIILDTNFTKGQYILKFQRFKDDELEYLISLSDQKLIPKIFFNQKFKIRNTWASSNFNYGIL